MSVDASDAPSDWRYVRWGLLLVAAIGAAQLVGWAVWSLVHDEPTTFDRVVACFETEKGVRLDFSPADPIAASAGAGAFSLVVEGNPVTVAIGRTDGEAAEIVARYGRVAGRLPTRLVQRGRVVYVFERPYSPTQLQALIDCEYVP